MAREGKTDILTVAAVLDNGEILFNERQQVYTLPEKLRASKGFPDLRGFIKRHVPVRAALNPKRGIVEKIETLPDEHIAEFRRLRPRLDNPAKTARINVGKLDPIAFNVVENLDWPVFKVCVKVIPNFAKAKQIFDFCAKQTCSLGGPFDITPCIPFQYVGDGCYARAHKMRKIITEKYKFCCEKVFSYGNPLPDRLAVKANKWGGCCVKWWYHVAPLVRVQFQIGPKASLTMAMVIDPGMFDAPVSLSTWLDAQENTACYPQAKVTGYSIQPGSAYAPMYTTDPDYTDTDDTLLFYANEVTCP